MAGGQLVPKLIGVVEGLDQLTSHTDRAGETFLRFLDISQAVGTGNVQEIGRQLDICVARAITLPAPPTDWRHR